MTPPARPLPEGAPPVDSVDPELARLAERVRRWREGAGLTLQDLARRSGVATSTIQKVETLQMVPTVAVLLKIARGLGRSASDFVEDGEVAPDVVHLRARERHPIGERRRMQFERLSGDLVDSEVELWRISVQPGHGSGRDELRYRGEAIVVCETGTLELQVGGDRFELEAGDSLHFKASLPHAWRNASTRPARFLMLGTVPAALRRVIQARVPARARKRT